jgi:hypothetical protein
VVQRLAAHFDDLADPATAEVLATSIANWRLKPDISDRIRVTCTRMPPLTLDLIQEQRDLERERSLTMLVQNLSS